LLELNYPPHVTLLACADLDMDNLRGVLPEFIASHPPLVVNFTGLGVFSGENAVVYLSLAWNRALLDLHEHFWLASEPYSVGTGDLYRPGNWVPHVTLDYGLPLQQVGPVVNALMQVQLPRYGLLRDVVLVDFQSGGSMLEERFKARLGQYL
jgi:2'-5' RNA ligase